MYAFERIEARLMNSLADTEAIVKALKVLKPEERMEVFKKFWTEPCANAGRAID